MRNKSGVDVRAGDYVSYLYKKRERSGVVKALERVRVMEAGGSVPRVVVTFDDGIEVFIDAIIRNDGRFEETAPGLLQRGNPAKRKTKTRTAPRRKAVPGKFNSPSQATGLAPTPRLVRRRKETAYAPPGIYANPSRVSVRAPSMATGKKPTTRLVKRREATNKAPRGYYANPASFRVESALSDSNNWLLRGVFPSKAAAHEYARAFFKSHSKKNWRVRVVSE